MKYKKFQFYNQNMLDFAKTSKNIKANVFHIPNVINYNSKDDFKNLLLNLKTNNLYQSSREIGSEEDSYFFLKARSIKDHRYGLGKDIGNRSFILDKDEFSGEENCLCTAYQEHELVGILKRYLNLYDFQVITNKNINIKNNVYIKDSDIIIYGKIN